MPLFTEEEKEYQRVVLPQLVAAGVLAPCRSNWSAKPKLVRKDNGKLRLVNTFCALNKATIKDAYPMRRLEPIIDAIGQDKIRVLFQCDAANGYYAVRNNLDDAYKTAFPSLHGRPCYLRMGQGLAGAPRTYSKLKDIVFGVIPAKRGENSEPPLSEVDPDVTCEYYMDDDLGGATTVDKLIWFLHNHYFPRVAWAKLTLSPSKCRFFSEEIKVLGFQKTWEGVRPHFKKQDVILNYPAPTNEKEMEHFLCLLPYFSDCIPGRADLATIIRSAVRVERSLETINGKRRRVKKDLGFEWTADCQRAFDRIKQAMKTSVIAGGDPTRQYHLATDASGTGAGGVLIQLDSKHPPGTSMFDVPENEQKVIKFLSFKFSDAETRYHTTEREFLSLLLAAKKCRHLICGSPFPVKVYTDHMAVLHILKDADNGRGRIAQWQYRLGEYNLEITHVPGKKMIVADRFSRLRSFPEPTPDTRELALRHEKLKLLEIVFIAYVD